MYFFILCVMIGQYLAEIFENLEFDLLNIIFGIKEKLIILTHTMFVGCCFLSNSLVVMVSMYVLIYHHSY